jgi:ubiquinone/menaquinone biosynthesis C-methylase UbiE
MQSKDSFYRILQPIYPLLAQQLVDDYGLDKGICIDLGSGPGHVGIEIAKITYMDIYFVDDNEEQLRKAEKRFEGADCDNLAKYIKSDAHNLVFEDNFADFIVSRGSLWFWKDPHEVLDEVYRVLKPGGKAFIGGGLGKYIPSTMRQRILEDNKRDYSKKGVSRPTFEEFRKAISKEMLDKTNLPGYRIIDEKLETGRWIEISKEEK